MNRGNLQSGLVLDASHKMFPRCGPQADRAPPGTRVIPQLFGAGSTYAISAIETYVQREV